MAHTMLLLTLQSLQKTGTFSILPPALRYSQSNRKIESAMKICENIMEKAARGKCDPYLGLLDY